LVFEGLSVALLSFVGQFSLLPLASLPLAVVLGVLVVLGLGEVV